MLTFCIIFFSILFGLLIRDAKITLQRQNNPKYFPFDRVIHPLSKSVFEIIRQATQEEIRKSYPAFSYRPYSAYWVKMIRLGSYNEDITLHPVAESMLYKI